MQNMFVYLSNFNTFVPPEFRGVAQLASALALGARGRVFESHHPDLLCREGRPAQGGTTPTD
jgi:hypothetical protein